MQAAPTELDIVDGVVIGTLGGPSITLGAVAAALAPASPTRGDREPGLAAEGWFHTKHQVYPYGSHLAVVKVDPDTGEVTIERYIAGYDIGRAINPMLVAGQIADTAKARNMTEDQVKKDVILAAQPSKEFVSIDEIASLAVYLCGDAAANITGAMLSIDGGWTAA